LVTVLILGGTGFIGTHLAQHLLRSSSTEILLVDIAEPRTTKYASVLQEGLRSGRVRYIQHDLRRPIPGSIVEGPVQRIYNLAAVHREPGHKAEEYFETNLLGAETACDLATRTGCNSMVFTSSISPYGPSEECKTEDSLPVPVTAYGSSKLAAEKIHLGWRAAGLGRKLLILRPGVVFGPGEGGNVTRLIRSLARGYFVYVGNRETRKAGGYVKELCSVIEFGLDYQDRTGQSQTLLNFSANPVPTLQEFVETISKTLGRRPPSIEIPRSTMLYSSRLISSVARPLGIKHPFDPVRVRKLWNSTYVDPARLRELGYVWRFSLEEAFRDWKRDCPEDFWGKRALDVTGGSY
jgi:nucleoside-diphosphate-sugar epimerase